MTEPGYAHIFSFRRQVYVQSDENIRILANFKVNYEGTNYWIYASMDNLTCFICKKEGHLARQCQSPVQSAEPEKMNSSHDLVGDLSHHVKVGTKRVLTSINSSTQDNNSDAGKLELTNETGKNINEKEPNTKPSKAKKTKITSPDPESKKLKELDGIAS